MQVISTVGNFNYVENEGYYLEGQGEIVLEYSTEGHAKLDNILVDSVLDSDESLEIANNMTIVENLNSGGIYEYELDLSRFKDITSLSVEEDDSANLILTQSVIAENRIRFLLSNNGVMWNGYNGISWVENYEMTKTELESLTSVEYTSMFGNKIYTQQLFIKVLIYSENPDNVVFKNATVTFKPNQAPTILNPIITPDQVHDEYVTLSADIVDYEGNGTEFRVSIQKANETSYYVANDWEIRNAETSISKTYNYPYFNTGENLVKLEVKDNQGLVSEWMGNVTIVNSVPNIVYTHDDFSVSGTIYDDDNDTVTYRLLVNGQVEQDYMEYAASPRNFSIKWDSSSVNIGNTNDITIEAKDNLGDTTSTTFQIIGKYNGLLFLDELGDYYTTDNGNLLKMLNIETLVAGQKSEIKKITFKNQAGSPIENITISSDETELPPNANVKFGYSLESFEETDSLIFDEILNHDATKDFYVSIHTNVGQGKLGSKFKINAEANIVES